jgi:hypothetical protein
VRLFGADRNVPPGFPRTPLLVLCGRKFAFLSEMAYFKTTLFMN